MGPNPAHIWWVTYIIKFVIVVSLGYFEKAKYDNVNRKLLQAQEILPDAAVRA